MKDKEKTMLAKIKLNAEFPSVTSTNSELTLWTESRMDVHGVNSRDVM